MGFNPNPPHKVGLKIASLNLRIQMVKAAIQNDDMFKFSEVDINRPGPHYVIDTVKIFKSQHQGAEIVFIMGGDSLRDLSTRFKAKDFVEECDWLGVMHRPGDRIDMKNIEQSLPGNIQKSPIRGGSSS